MSIEEHTDFHRDLNDHLENYRDAHGNTMRPSSTNDRTRIQRNFSRAERLSALADFYEEFANEYISAARDFFAQHPELAP